MRECNLKTLFKLCNRYQATVVSNGCWTYSHFKLGEGGHVDDADGLFAAFDLFPNNIKPVRLVEGLALVQGQQICTQPQKVFFLLFLAIFSSSVVISLIVKKKKNAAKFP